jgi:iron(III) transport system substrate-binding protein
MTRVLTAVLIAGALVVAACAESPTEESEGGEGSAASDETGFEEVFAAIDGLSGAERTEKLIELSEQEGGQLNLYTSMTSDVVDGLAGAFEDEFDIEPSVYRADSETVLRRLIEEASAGFRGSDIVETNGPELASLNNEGILVGLDSPVNDALVDNAVEDGWTTDRFNKFVISWNTEKVAESDVPPSWEDLADPKWDGQLALEPSDIDWYKTLWEYWVNEAGMSEQEADGIFEQMAQDALFVKGHTLVGDLLAAGEFSVAASNYSYLVENVKEEGAPVAWEPPVEPVISRPNGIALVRGAQHPATAVLFMEWVLSDGQETLQEFNLDPARADIVTTPGTDEIFVDVESYVNEQAEWTDRYEQLVTLGKVVE